MIQTATSIVLTTLLLLPLRAIQLTMTGFGMQQNAIMDASLRVQFFKI
jgi:hypothetical protein